MPTIATLTLNPTIDKSSTVNRVVAEHKLRCSPPEFDPGGGGINVARAIVELGGQATAWWAGGGALGLFLSELLDRGGLDHRRIPIDGMTRENVIIYEEVSGQQYRFGMPGPEFTPADAERCRQAVAQLDPPPDYLVLSGSLPPGVGDDFYAQIVRRAPAGSRVIVDTSGPPLRLALDAGVFLVKPNLRELGQLIGKEIEHDPEIEAAARQIIDAGQAQAVVVSLGSGGVVLVTADGADHVRSPTVPIRSKVGAGDSTVGGLVLGLSRGDTFGEAVRRGVAAGAACVMTPGTQLCRRDDAERLYRQMTG